MDSRTPSSQPPPRLRPLAVVSVGIGCLWAGVLIGSSFGAQEPRHVYREPAPPALPPRAAAPASFADVVERATPAVVAVRCMSSPATAAAPQRSGSSAGVMNGSGFVINSNGLCLTARHLTANATRIVVEVPRLGRYDAELVGEDDVTDLAVLRLVGAPGNLRALELGPSEELRAGDWIVAVGNPYGLKHTVTAGVVSFVGRHLRDDARPVSSEFVQFSAPVNPGSSGCPVLDLDGRVVGITSQAADIAQGMAFAVPSRTVKWVLDAMDRSPDGRVHRGYLGIRFDSRPGLDDNGQQLEGALVHSVGDDSAAHAAGLLPGDVVLLFDSHPVIDAGDLHERITRTAPGTEVHLTVLRGGKVIDPIRVQLRDAAGTGEDDGKLVH